MTDSPARDLRRRRQHLVDKPLQLSVSGKLAGFLFAGLVLYMVALQLVSSAFAEQLTGTQIAEITLGLNVFAVVGLVAGLFFLAIRVTHRFVGPARVIESALEGILHGGSEQRSRLRRGDHLRGIAERVGSLSGQLTARHEEWSRITTALERALDECDIQLASRHLAELRRGLGLETERAESGAPLAAAASAEL